MSLWMFAAAVNTLIEAFGERVVSTIKVAPDEEPQVPRPVCAQRLSDAQTTHCDLCCDVRRRGVSRS